MSKEHPILFSAPMVRALLDGRKTQTRRIVKNVPEFFGDEENSASGHQGAYISSLTCPYGQPGDQLWVKETFVATVDGGYFYRASIPYGSLDCHFKPWKPSIFCTRAASRIQLEITSVRVERLQEISEADATAEGVTWQNVQTKEGAMYDSNQDAYAALWESINGAGSWAANPWVWVVEFKRVKP